jgi:hypothetical protein
MLHPAKSVAELAVKAKVQGQWEFDDGVALDALLADIARCFGGGLLAPPAYCDCFGCSPHSACETVRIGDLQDVWPVSLISFSEPTFIFDLDRKLGLRDPKALTRISMG